MERIQDRYKDGRIKSISGSGVVAEAYTYNFVVGDIEITKQVGNGLEKRWQKQVVDTHGNRHSESELAPLSLANFGQPVTNRVVDTKSYSFAPDLGQLYKTTSSSDLFKLFATFDKLGRLESSGVTASSNFLTESSLDRMVKFERYFEQDSSKHWWDVANQITFETDDSAVPTIISSKKFLLNPALTQPDEVTLSTDEMGLTTRVEVSMDRSNAKRTVKTSRSHTPGFFHENTYVNGMLVSSKLPDSTAATEFFYNGYAKLVRQKDPRGGSTQTWHIRDFSG